jgi:hypothetical protein
MSETVVRSCHMVGNAVGLAAAAASVTVQHMVRPDYWRDPDQAKQCAICELSFEHDHEHGCASTIEEHSAMAVFNANPHAAAIDTGALPVHAPLVAPEDHVFVDKTKVHCRACGEVVCIACSTAREFVPEMGWVKQRVPVCAQCSVLRQRRRELRQGQAGRANQQSTEDEEQAECEYEQIEYGHFQGYPSLQSPEPDATTGTTTAMAGEPEPDKVVVVGEAVVGEAEPLVGPGGGDMHGSFDDEDECVLLEPEECEGAPLPSFPAQQTLENVGEVARVVAGAVSRTHEIVVPVLSPILCPVAKGVAALATSMVRPQYWQRDCEITECTVCAESFDGGDHRRKHHCRSCGNGVCGDCSMQRMPVPERTWEYPVRVCDRCYSDRKRSQPQGAATYRHETASVLAA